MDSPTTLTIIYTNMTAKKTQSSRPGRNVRQQDIDVNQIAEIIHKKITTHDKDGHDVITEDTGVRMNLTTIFSIIGSLIVGVAASSIYLTNKDVNYSTTLESHDKRLTNVERYQEEIKSMRVDVAVLKDQVGTLVKSVDSQKAAVDYMVDNIKQNNPKPR